MPVALFIYQHIYCRYLCPGECIVHDMGSEFCNKLSQQLHDAHDVEIRITSAGHPQSNGQAESAVKNIKAKMQAFMIEIGDKLFSRNLQGYSHFPHVISLFLFLSLSLSLCKQPFPHGIHQIFSPGIQQVFISPRH